MKRILCGNDVPSVTWEVFSIKIHIMFLCLVLTIIFMAGMIVFAQSGDMPVNVALGKPVKASSFRGETIGDLVVDGVWDTRESRWVSGKEATPPHSLEIDLQGTFIINSADVWTGDPTSKDPHVIDAFRLQYWTGDEWADIPGASVRDNDQEVVYFSFTELITTDRVRFYYDEPSGVIRVREILIYGVANHGSIDGDGQYPWNNDEPTGPDLSIVQDGNPNAIVIIPNNANLRIVQGANSLVDYVKQSTGAQLRVMTESTYLGNSNDYPGFIRMFIGDGFGQRDYDEVINKALDNLDEQGFVIHTCNDSITIVGPSIWGTLNGVHEFLERFVGVRWLMIGPSGEDVPTLTHIDVPMKSIREQPAFSLRALSNPFFGGDPYNPFAANRVESEWAHRNKLQGEYNHEIKFSHNLHTIFPVEKFGETNPEFYPKGIPPEPGDIRRWQPCFSVNETIDVAVQHIIHYFNENPDQASFALGVNDIGGFCEQDRSHPAYPGKLNSSGYVHMSDIFFAWVNEVVEQVTEVHPNKWFALSAYREVMDPPSFPLHPRVIPRITKDRMTWIDEEVRSIGHRQMAEWTKVANQIGLYDYMYGFVYHVPRPFPHLMAETIKYARDHHVISWFIENQHHAGEGPKVWLLAKLLWNPDQDIDALLIEWYERAVGPEAADDLAAFYELWEHFWTVRMVETPWFQHAKHATYLPFSEQSYLKWVTEEDIHESIRLLDLVVAKAETEQQKRRAGLIREAFDYYEAAALSYPKALELPTDPKDNANFIDVFGENIRRRIELAERRYELTYEFRQHLDKNMTIRSTRGGFFFEYWWTDWTGWNSLDLPMLNNYMRIYEPDGGPMTDRLIELSQGDDDFLRTLSYFIWMSRGSTVDAPSLIQNSSFEDDNLTSSAWRFEIEQGGTIERVEGHSHTGHAALKADQVRHGRISQLFTVEKGLTAAQVHYYTPKENRTGTIQVEIHGQNARGQTLMSLVTPVTLLASTSGQWSSLELIDVLSSGLDRVDITQAEIVITIQGAQNTEVYIDDVVVFQNVPPGANIQVGSAPDERPNIALGKPTKASSVGSAGSAPAVDGDLASRWFTQSGATPPHWLEVDLLGMFAVEQAEIWSGVVGQSTGPYSIGHMQLQYWTGDDWKDIPGASVRNNRDELITFTFSPPVITDQIRFVSEMKESPDGVGLRFREILLYGEPH